MYVAFSVFFKVLYTVYCIEFRNSESVWPLVHVMCLSLSGDALIDSESSTLTKGHEEELRQLEDEIAACKWTHTHSMLSFPVPFFVHTVCLPV